MVGSLLRDKTPLSKRKILIQLRTIDSRKEEWENLPVISLGKLSTVRGERTKFPRQTAVETGKESREKSLVYKINKLSQGPISTLRMVFMDERIKNKRISRGKSGTKRK